MDGMDGTCGMHGDEEICMSGFSWGNLKEGDHLEILDIDGRVVLIWILKLIGWYGKKWVHLV